MIKKTFKTTDINGNEIEVSAYFELSKMDVIALANDDKNGFKDKLEAFQNKVNNKETIEFNEVVDILHAIIRMGYRVVKHTDMGDLLVRNDEATDAFINSNVGDDFIMSLMEKPEEFTGFFLALFPKNISDEIRKNMMNQGTPVHPAVSATAGAPANMNNQPQTYLEALNNAYNNLNH